MKDGELLRRYVADHSEAAFGELVRRHLDLVYSAALRQVNGDSQLAEDVAQSVFMDLSRKAGSLLGHSSLAGWLYTSTRFAATAARRGESRRRFREHEAHAMNRLLDVNDSEPDWTQIRPLLDEAMHTLDEADREAVLLRHFKQCSYAEIGAQLGVSENAARMRVERALEKLHAALSKRGVTSTALALGGVLTSNAVGAAPVHLPAQITHRVLAAAAGTGGLGAFVARIFSTSKMTLATVSVGLVVIVAAVVVARQRQPRPPNMTAAAAPGILNANKLASVSNLEPVSASSVASVSVPPRMNRAVMHLKVVATDSGRPIPGVRVIYTDWQSEPSLGPNAYRVLMGNQATTDQTGCCDVYYLKNRMLDVALQLDGFADTRLSWRPSHGDVIPADYRVRLDRAVAIGGRVVGPDGEPVAGARVVWLERLDPATRTLPQYHELSYRNPQFGYRFGELRISVDQGGKWRANEIAADLLPQIDGYAKSSNFVSSDPVFPGQDPATQKRLRHGTYVFHLKPAAVVTGVLVNTNGTPISHAKIIVGNSQNGQAASGQTERNGKFSIPGCPLGKVWVTATAAGYTPTTVTSVSNSNPEPVHVVLRPCHFLRLRVVDQEGRPIRHALAFLHAPGVLPEVSVLTSFVAHSDGNGRITFSNAPAGDLHVRVEASGYMEMQELKVRADGKLNTVTLAPALLVHGMVLDKYSGTVVPRFHIKTGWANINPASGTTNVYWSTQDNFLFSFANGKFRQTFTEPVAPDGSSSNYVLKFVADGYAPWVSRPIAADEGNVKLDVRLTPAEATQITLYNPDGQPAGHTTVGLIYPQVKLHLNRAGSLCGPTAVAGALVQTDPNGAFNLPPDRSITRIVAANARGFAEADADAARKATLLQLQPWGRLEVTCVDGDQPAAGRDYQLEFSGGVFDCVSFKPPLHVTTDGRGQFRVSHIPPGRHRLTREHLDRFMFFRNWLPGDRTSFDVQPGEVTQLTLGTNEVNVTAQLRWPAGIQRQPEWQMIARLETPMPHPPKGLGKAGRSAFYQSADFQNALRDHREYPMALKDGNRLVTAEVQPGHYEVNVVFGQVATNGTTPYLKLNFNRVVEATVPVTVTAEAPQGVFDAGVITLKPVPSKK